MSPNQLPVVFVSHGAPTASVDHDETTEFWKKYGKTLAKNWSFKSVLLVSAHWESNGPLRISGAEKPEIIYDYFGFPKKYYDVSYNAKGSPELAQKVAQLLNGKSIPCQIDMKRGLDHGAWVPSIFMFPNGSVPIVQLSLSSSLDPSFHVKLGNALSELRKEGVLVVCSGSAIHNIAERYDEKPWCRYIEGKIDDAMKLNAEQRTTCLVALMNDPQFIQAHPRSEHYMPLVVASAAGTPSYNDTLSTNAQKVHERITWGNLSMAMYQFD